ncbi:ABC transporter permease [Streptomyces beijiangensis]|uniref:ABC transporter permease n=1 Tax=Streptomyces beijiangensis TaxID=163361 RepID=A0A939JGW6_9ACTN|nr:ABC transporter permease [Streptomyces beijiangensis]MBO0515626.1 ABC transporter permease [Streptomyces beijiangensis]
MTAVAWGAPARSGSRQLAGTNTLLRLALRRDRIMIPVWVLVVGGSFASVTGSFAKLYDTAAKRADVAHSMGANSSMRALYGPVFSDSLGGLTAWRMVGFGAALAAVMSLVIVVRHTREEEETGRQELISSAVVGRRAPLTAALLTALIANAVLALMITAGLAKSGEPEAGSLALGLGTAGVGMLFACTAAIAAQLTESARLAKGMTAAVIGAAFVLKAAGDASTDDGSSVLTWLSPIGWAENVRAFGGERWWVLLVLAGAIAVQAVVAYRLAGRRDVGMSFLPTRPGPADGALGSAGSLAWRLQRGSVYGWSAGFLAAGVIFGGITGGAADLVGDNEQAREIFERMGGQSGLTDAFLAAMTGMLGLVAALFIVATVLRLHGEETSQRTEPLLAGAVGRLRWAAGHLVVAFAGSVLIMSLGGVGLAVGYGHDLGPILVAALVQLPAIWVVGGLTFLLYGAFPKAAVAGWGVAGLVLALGWIGPALDLPRTVLGLSPFGHLPKLPGGEMAWTPVLLLTAIAAALVAGGLAGLRRRDLTT